MVELERWLAILTITYLVISLIVLLLVLITIILVWLKVIRLKKKLKQPIAIFNHIHNKPTGKLIAALLPMVPVVMKFILNKSKSKKS